MLSIGVLPTNIQDRDGGPLLLKYARRALPFVERIFADAGYQGEPATQRVRATSAWQLAIVKRNNLRTIEVLPKRWIVERTFAWFGRRRLLAKDLESLAASAIAFIYLAMIRLMLRRMVRPTT